MKIFKICRLDVELYSLSLSLPLLLTGLTTTSFSSAYINDGLPAYFTDKVYNKTVTMAKQITQQTFDNVVKENIEEFDMTPEEAVQDAVQQFEIQVDG